jgi:hypothetical protein
MNDPFKIDGPACISLSGGRTSAYMLWRILQAHGGKLPAGAVVCFANTGKEDERTLDFVNECRWKWDVNIHWLEFDDNFAQGGDGVKVVDYQCASREGEPFAALIAKRKYLPNAVTRFCTSDLKIKPIETFMRRTYGDFDMVVGIRADEPRRVAKMRHLHLPLAIAGVSKQDVLAFWKKQPFDLKAEDGNCDLCFNKGVHQIMSSIRQRPSKAVWWAKQEAARGATFAKDRPSYAQMKEYAESQQEMFGNNDETIACFCGD